MNKYLVLVILAIVDIATFVICVNAAFGASKLKLYILFLIVVLVSHITKLVQEKML
jgi:hypothetical protein